MKTSTVKVFVHIHYYLLSVGFSSQRIRAFIKAIYKYCQIALQKDLLI